MTRLSRVLAVVTLGLGSLAAFSLASDPRAILGRWHGTSICVKASWNSACNDEEIVYDFVPRGTDSTHSLQHAFKIVGGQLDPMGDLDITYSPKSDTWDADFANARVRIRWSYWFHGDTLLGQVIRLPDSLVGRHVVALRSKVEP